MTVLAATAWNTNADLIADCFRLGYLRTEWVTLDATFGRGNWWKKARPTILWAQDLREMPEPWPDVQYLAGIDFRHQPWDDDAFDACAFDPPYVCVGGRATTGTPDMHDRYGMTDAPRSPRALQDVIDEGLAECARVTKPGGHLLVKVQDYVSSGSLWPGTFYTTQRALDLGLVVLDRLEMIGSPRPQPPGRRQVHARRNLSTLLVLKRPVTSADATRRNQAKKRAILAEIKTSRGCADCGYSAHPAALDFDHRPGEVKELSIGRQVSNAGIERLLAEVAKCDVVCANCHRVRTIERDQHRPSRKVTT